ncbi:MAG: ATP synthase F1 subunit delta [bacterium]|nr:ATP synthase F1 subunit delta [bacterium]
MTRTARQYAEALRASVPDFATYPKLIADLTSVAGSLETDATVRAFFTSRTTPSARKEKVLHDVFQDSLSGRTYAFLRVLIANHEVHLLASVIVHAERRADAEDQTARVHVTTAVPLSSRVRARLEEVIAARTKRRVIAAYDEQSSLIGGMRIVIDHTTQWDASVAGRFARLQERIRSTV